MAKIKMKVEDMTMDCEKCAKYRRNEGKREVLKVLRALIQSDYNTKECNLLYGDLVESLGGGTND